MDEIEEVVEGIFRFAGITVRTFCQIFADAKFLLHIKMTIGDDKFMFH